MNAQPNITDFAIERVTWRPDTSSLGPASSRRPIKIETYLPGRIAESDWVLGSSLSQSIVAAEQRVRELEFQSAQIGLDTIARHLLRAESVASSRIEGYVMSNRRLAKAAVTDSHDPTAKTILGNIAALRTGYDWAAAGHEFSQESICDLHETLFHDTRDDALGGVVRASQNWLGGDASSPANAEFVPPAPEHVPGLLDDLAEFCNRDDIPAILQAAIAHAQFETIHPFMDGNGRIGRALIGMIMIKRGLAQSAVPPVSLVLGANADLYIRGLTSYRYSNADDWFTFFSDVVATGASAAATLAESIANLQEEWLEQAGNPRMGSAPRRLIESIPAQPVLTLAHAVELTGLSDEASRQALNRLEAAGVIRETTAGKRNRVWESVGLFALMDEFERAIGDRARTPAETN